MGKKKDEDLELDLAGVNGLRNSDYTLLCRLCSCRRGWPNYIARVGEGGRNYIVGTHYGLTGIFFPQEKIGSHSHSDGARGI